MSKISNILMQPEMALATLEGRKKVTRRLNGLGEINKRPNDFGAPIYDKSDGRFVFTAECGSAAQHRVKPPYGAPGDLVWVRERWQTRQSMDHIKPSDLPIYGEILHFAGASETWGSKIRPSIFMPRWASRMTLIVTDVRLERLQDIGKDSSIDEGIYYSAFYDGYVSDKEGRCFSNDPVDSFAKLWESINGEGSWASNPWLWVVEFEPVMLNVDKLKHCIDKNTARTSGASAGRASRSLAGLF